MLAKRVLAVSSSARSGKERQYDEQGGKLPIPVLDKATVSVDGQTVRAEGPKGKLENLSTTPSRLN